MTRMLERLPGWLVRLALRVTAFLTEDVGLDLRRFGAPRDA